MNTVVNFELAKLLKEKGINIYSEYRYTDFNGIERLEKNASDIFPYAPTIAEVVMWLYEKHDVWISLIPDISSGHQLLMRKMSVHLFRYRNGLNVQTETLKDSGGDIIYFLSPTKAYEAAIEYTLKNLV